MTKYDPYMWNDPQVNAARQLLERVLNDAHWRASQRYHKRKIIERFTNKISWTGVIVGLGFLGTLYLTSRIGFTDQPYSGILVVLAAGMLGASFSVLINTNTRDFNASIEELERRTARSVVFLRLCVGTVGAVILYFFFEAGLVEGVLFPDLESIGFAAVAFGKADPNVLVDLGHRIHAFATLAQSQATDLAMATESSMAQVTGTDRDKTINAMFEIKGAMANLSPAIEKIIEKAHQVPVDPKADDLKALVSTLHSLQGLSAKAMVAAQPINDNVAAAGPVSALSEQLLSTLSEVSDLAATDGRRHFGKFVPNADLSKMIVWSFLAGFSELLVANMLRKVENSASKD